MKLKLNIQSFKVMLALFIFVLSFSIQAEEIEDLAYLQSRQYFPTLFKDHVIFFNKDWKLESLPLSEGTPNNPIVDSILNSVSDPYAISASDDNFCLLSHSEGAKCFGENPLITQNVPEDLRLVHSIAVSDSHACAVTLNLGEVCWGKNSHGQLNSDQNSPVLKKNVPIMVSVDTSITCRIFYSGKASCSGVADAENIDFSFIKEPILISASSSLICVVEKNKVGMHCLSLVNNSWEPVDVKVSFPVKSLSVSNNTVCFSIARSHRDIDFQCNSLAFDRCCLEKHLDDHYFSVVDTINGTKNTHCFSTWEYKDIFCWDRGQKTGIEFRNINMLSPLDIGSLQTFAHRHLPLFIENTSPKASRLIQLLSEAISEQIINKVDNLTGCTTEKPYGCKDLKYLQDLLVNIVTRTDREGSKNRTLHFFKNQISTRVIDQMQLEAINEGHLSSYLLPTLLALQAKYLNLLSNDQTPWRQALKALSLAYFKAGNIHRASYEDHLAIQSLVDKLKNQTSKLNTQLKPEEIFIFNTIQSMNRDIETLNRKYLDKFEKQ